MKSIIYFLCLLNYCSWSQETTKNDVSIALHLPNWTLSPNDNLKSFTLKAVDSTNKILWKSNVISDFIDDDVKGIFTIIDVPSNIYPNIVKFWCEANINKKVGGHSSCAFQNVTQDFGGVELSQIKLHVKSNPKGGSIYLIPFRIYEKYYKNQILSDTLLLQFKINSSKTDVITLVDETVYMVICMLNNKIKMAYHNTKPFNIESNQVISFDY